MDEEETYRRLRRVSFEEMKIKIQNTKFTNSEELEKLCNINGWTSDEVNQEEYRRLLETINELKQMIIESNEDTITGMCRAPMRGRSRI